MGYLHISNLYRDQDVLLFRECFAMEKVHGTSAHITWNPSSESFPAELGFFGGGEGYDRFIRLFDIPALGALFAEAFKHLVDPAIKVMVYGEAYGGRCQGMKDTYGPDLRFIVFDVRVGNTWLSVLDAAEVVSKLGLEFVPYVRTSTDIAVLDGLRDAWSEVAVRRGCGQKPREGIVIRPVIEVTKNNGDRVMAKHKGEAFAERLNTPRVGNPDELKVLDDAEAIATEWVTYMRLAHVLDKMPGATIEHTRDIINAMIADVVREAAGEIVDNRAVRVAIGKMTVKLFKRYLREGLERP